jgi:hypothetical protein
LHRGREAGDVSAGRRDDVVDIVDDGRDRDDSAVGHVEPDVGDPVSGDAFAS